MSKRKLHKAETNRCVGTAVLGFSHPYEEQMCSVWDQFWPEAPAVILSEISGDSLPTLARVIHHLRTEQALPRRLPAALRYHRKDSRSYQQAFYNMRTVDPSPAGIVEQFWTWHPENASGVVVFLETWLDEDGGNDDSMVQISETICNFCRKYGRRLQFESMDDTTFGDLIATLIVKCNNSLKSMRASEAALQALFRLSYRVRPMGVLRVFAVVFRRLERRDIIQALYLAARVLERLTYDNSEYQSTASDLFHAVNDEIWVLEREGQSRTDVHVLRLRTCVHIVIYIARYGEYFEAEKFIFKELSDIAVYQIGEHAYTKLWSCLGRHQMFERMEGDVLEELSKDLTSHLKVDTSVVMLDYVQADKPHSELLDRQVYELEAEPAACPPTKRTRRNKVSGKERQADNLIVDLRGNPGYELEARRPSTNRTRRKRSRGVKIGPRDRTNFDRTTRYRATTVDNNDTAVLIVPVNRPHRSQSTPFELDRTVQGVQRNKKQDETQKQLADSPPELMRTLKKEKERIRKVLGEAIDAETKAKPKNNFTWMRKVLQIAA